MHDFERMTPDLYLDKEEIFREKLQQSEVWKQIPLINGNITQELPGGSLVRLKGMVQDIHNPDFYFENFMVYNSVTKESTSRSGKYRDNSDIHKNEKISYTENLVSGERLPVVVVPMPGYNNWAELIDNKHKAKYQTVTDQQPTTSKRLDPVPLKRSYDKCADGNCNTMEEDSEKIKEPKTCENMETCDVSTDSNVSNEISQQNPLNCVSGDSLMVVIYDDIDNIKLNEMVEIIGFLNNEPAVLDENELIDAETLGRPVLNIGPRIHAVQVKKLEHCNPLIQNPIDKDTVLKEANYAREHLLKTLTELLLGDNLAAEYLIYHLISHVYIRHDTLSLGKFCLNISNVPTEKYPNYTQKLYDVIKELVTKSYYLPLTIENMNTMALLPIKDYDINKLKSGVLQLSKGTHLFIDETKMQEGMLNNTGVHNIKILGELITNQELKYEFKFCKVTVHTDVPVLILSEGKSLLSSDYFVPLQAEESSLNIFDAIVEAAMFYLNGDVMNKIRKYLTAIKLIQFDIGEDNMKFVQDDFVEMRSHSTEDNPVTQFDLHRLLVLARLVCLSRGLNTLTKECWDITKDLETRRLLRVKARTPNLNEI